MKVIINADDCGINKKANLHIKEAIEKGKITSTTIMANMDDIEGALSLYENFHNSISFGVHLNLTEGEPILKSKMLLDYGFYSEVNDRIAFDGQKAESFRYKILPQCIKSEIYEELSAQIELLRKSGIELSHMDSHHHIHTCFSLIEVMAELSKKHGLPKVRRIRNYTPRSLNFYGRQAWAVLSRLENRDYIMTDFFSIFKDFFNEERIPQLNNCSSIELMIHPGGYSEDYEAEERMMLDMTYPYDFELINYKEL